MNISWQSQGSLRDPHLDEVAGALREVDWDFRSRRPADGLEGIHPYPAKFIPELPGSLLDALPIKPGTAVLDPFVGSGTTLVECQRRGIASFGIDLNPIACLLSRVKTAPHPNLLGEAVQRVLSMAKAAQKPALPSIPNLDHWFTAEVQEEVARLLCAIDEAPQETQAVLRLAMSSILVRVSNQDSDTRYAAVTKHLPTGEVARLFANSATKINLALTMRDYPLTQANVIESDALAFDSEAVSQPIGAVITSPPYPNAYEYWLYHKYRMWWLGYDPLEVKRLEIGARAHFFKPNPHTAADFSRQMAQLFSRISEVLIPGGFACFIVGRSRIHGEIVDNAEIICQAGGLFGFREIFRAERTISATRKSFNLSHANIKTETVLVLSR